MTTPFYKTPLFLGTAAIIVIGVVIVYGYYNWEWFGGGGSRKEGLCPDSCNMCGGLCCCNGRCVNGQCLVNPPDDDIIKNPWPIYYVRPNPRPNPPPPPPPPPIGARI